MTNVPSARKYGFELRLNEAVMRQALNSAGVKKLVSQAGQKAKADVAAHVTATVSAAHADNYVAALFAEDAFSDEYGFDFEGPYELGRRPIAVVGIPAGRGPNPDAMPPLMVEARTHALSTPEGFTVGPTREDIR